MIISIMSIIIIIIIIIIVIIMIIIMMIVKVDVAGVLKPRVKYLFSFKAGCYSVMYYIVLWYIIV